MVDEGDGFGAGNADAALEVERQCGGLLRRQFREIEQVAAGLGSRVQGRVLGDPTGPERRDSRGIATINRLTFSTRGAASDLYLTTISSTRRPPGPRRMPVSRAPVVNVKGDGKRLRVSRNGAQKPSSKFFFSTTTGDDG